jgi:adenylate cyclase
MATSMSGDPKQEYFADGIVEEIITALSRFKWFVRHHPQFDLYVQRPSDQYERGRTQAWRALSP